MAEPTDLEMTTHCGLSHVRECGASPPPPPHTQVSPTQKVEGSLSSCPLPGSEQQCPCGGPPSGQPPRRLTSPSRSARCPRGSGHRPTSLPASPAAAPGAPAAWPPFASWTRIRSAAPRRRLQRVYPGQNALPGLAAGGKATEAGTYDKSFLKRNGRESCETHSLST